MIFVQSVAAEFIMFFRSVGYANRKWSYTLAKSNETKWAWILWAIEGQRPAKSFCSKFSAQTMEIVQKFRVKQTSFETADSLKELVQLKLYILVRRNA